MRIAYLRPAPLAFRVRPIVARHSVFSPLPSTRPITKSYLCDAKFRSFVKFSDQQGFSHNHEGGRVRGVLLQALQLKVQVEYLKQSY